VGLDKQFRALGDLVVDEIVDANMCTLTGKGESDPPADTLASAGDERAFTV
jgi:hypothetical protein